VGATCRWQVPGLVELLGQQWEFGPSDVVKRFCFIFCNFFFIYFSFLFLFFFFPISNFKHSTQIQIHVLNFHFPSVKINPNVNLNSTVYNIIIYSFPYHSFKIGGQIYVFNKMHHHKIINKRSTFLYLFIGYFLVSLIDYEKEGSK
jgi:hypothetical protein